MVGTAAFMPSLDDRQTSSFWLKPRKQNPECQTHGYSILTDYHRKSKLLMRSATLNKKQNPSVGEPRLTPVKRGYDECAVEDDHQNLRYKNYGNGSYVITPLRTPQSSAMHHYPGETFRRENEEKCEVVNLQYIPDHILIPRL
jgi:hypothetical protein